MFNALCLTHHLKFFAKCRDVGTDLDWGTQWTNVHLPLLKSANIKTVLDLGCGTGNDVLRLVQQGFTVISVDFSDEAVRLRGDREFNTVEELRTVADLAG
ncbi:class I SAM-dependent methyltransferase [Nostoc sp. UHCC 0302]|uniref:class I SAM-dependent methyltransferase n=1 Tax=Nostoc sp. UHCC 0302 TaxID=3134896 RepID=UPI00311CC793